MIGKLAAILFCLCQFVSAQDVITTDAFKKTRGVVCVEFWESWNVANECKWLGKLEGAEIYRMKSNTSIAKKLGVKSLPTIAVFEKQNLISIFEADISFNLPAGTQKKVQRAIDDLMLSKF
tara:strand:- start:8190 stop:8552 length:363 start_codon:yes stop_codon:yes gene_type:complete